MEIFNEKVCISHEELTESIITTSNLKALVRRGKVERARRGGNGRTALYAVDDLPWIWRTEVYRHFPDLHEQTESKEFVNKIKPDARALDFFHNYTLGNGRFLPETKIMEYATNAAVMNAIIYCRQFKRKRQETDKAFWERAAAALPIIAKTVPHSLPRSPQGLHKAVVKYIEFGYVSLISGKYGNNNAKK